MRLIEGNRDVVALLEGLLESARQGELIAVIACTVYEGTEIGASWDHKPDMQHAWARMLASISSAQHDFIRIPNED